MQLIGARVGGPSKMIIRLLAALVLCLTVPGAAYAAGFRLVEVPADAEGPALSGAMWYPCSEPPGKIDLGPITVSGARNCPVTGQKLPLLVISHGNLGAFFDHHDTAETLAEAGFVVAAISHPGDNVPDRSSDPSLMVRRPTDIKRLISFMVGASPAASNIDFERIGFFGFSAGGYTGLVLIGAVPDWAAVLCRFSSANSGCAQTLRKAFQAQPLGPEPRIKAAVIADPFWPEAYSTADSFAAVKAPVQLWASQTGGRGLPNIVVTPESVAAVNKSLVQAHEYHVVPNAGHFAFLLCGPSIKPVPEFCADAPGFDRIAFHKQFNADVLKYFRAQFGGK
jgi:predicted dienelactone hydrolase